MRLLLVVPVFFVVLSALLQAQDGPLGAELSERIGPYMQKGRLVLRLQQDWEKRYAKWKSEYRELTRDEKIEYCIFQLRNESWSEWDYVGDESPYSDEPEATASRELIKLGRHAIPRLLDAMKSRVSTRIYYRRLSRTPWLVQDVALYVIESIACRSLEPDGQANLKLSGSTESESQKLREKVRGWWAEHKGSNEVEWAKEVLLSEDPIPGANRHLAIVSLYDRLGKRSYPSLVKAYGRLPKGRDDAGTFDETRLLKAAILQMLLRQPSESEHHLFADAVKDAPLGLRIQGARGLWKLDDPSGLNALVEETEQRLLNDFGTRDLDIEYDNLTGFLLSCNTPRSRQLIFQCLRGRNPYLRSKAIRLVPKLSCENAVRALPELFDDPFVLSGSYMQYVGNVASRVPPRQICDEAAQKFTELVPDAPRFGGTTDEEQRQSIQEIAKWWNANRRNLTWDAECGMLVLQKGP